jgi:ABC-type branched-subunit amino acid transport system substrate-binding protein
MPCVSLKSRLGAFAPGIALSIALLTPALAQTGEPIKISFSMALTGGLAADGKSALLSQKIWEEDVNAKGGLLGRPVRLIYYDDKSAPPEVPQQAARYRQSQSGRWPLCDGADRADDADRDPEAQTVH